jgi:threonine aldolase
LPKAQTPRCGLRAFWANREFGATRAEDEVFVRLVTSFSTAAADVEALIALAKGGGSRTKKAPRERRLWGMIRSKI